MMQSGGISWPVNITDLWRHKLACKYNRFDDESGLLHLAHEAWNTLAELELMLRGELEG
jgi:hypothetical protein